MSYRFGGYLVTQRVPRPATFPERLLPPSLITASPCIGWFVPDAWALGWTGVSDEERRAAAVALGLDDAAAIVRFVTDGFDAGWFGWPNVVKSREALAALFARLPRAREWIALGLALDERHVRAFLDETAPVGGAAEFGVRELVARGLAPPPSARPLGFEPLGFDQGGAPHSWLCNDLARECERALGIRPGEHGLLATEEEAERATAHVARPETGAEPALWLPWLLLDCAADAA